MIAFLRGRLLSIAEGRLLLDVRDVGYEVIVPDSQVFAPYLQREELLLLPTYLQVREDAHILYGFQNQQQRVLFQTLLEINGVGPKLALQLLAHFDVSTFVDVVLSDDLGRLVEVKGLGEKGAKRICLELQGRLTKQLSSRESRAKKGARSKAKTVAAEPAVTAKSLKKSSVASLPPPSSSDKSTSRRAMAEEVLTSQPLDEQESEILQGFAGDLTSLPRASQSSAAEGLQLERERLAREQQLFENVLAGLSFLQFSEAEAKARLEQTFDPELGVSENIRLALQGLERR